LETRSEWCAASYCLAQRIRKLGPPIGEDILVLESTSVCRRAKDSALGATTGQCDPYYVREEPSRAGCGSGVPHIVHSQKGTLEKASAPPEPPGCCSCVCPPWSYKRTSCLITRVASNATAECLALCIRIKGPSKRRVHPRNLQDAVVACVRHDRISALHV